MILKKPHMIQFLIIQLKWSAIAAVAISVVYAIVWAVRKYLIYRDSKQSEAFIAKNIKFGMRIRYIDRLSKTPAPIIGRVVKCDYQRRYVIAKTDAGELSCPTFADIKEILS